MGFGLPKIVSFLLLTGAWTVYEASAFILPRPLPVTQLRPPALCPLPPLPSRAPRLPAWSPELQKPPSSPRPLAQPEIRRTWADQRLPRILGAWLEGKKGLSYRVNFLDARGLSRMGPDGLKGYQLQKKYEEPRFQAPREFWGTYALFIPGDTVRFEIELVNGSGRAINDLKVLAQHEDFNPQGAGALQTRVSFDGLDALRLEPGEELTIQGSFTLGRSASEYRISLSQVHLAAWSIEEKSVLIDDAHAGIIDPPSDG
ncbi:MAG: hypothetical protein ABIJ96_06240 [Elusimicrobiota bacterium]